MFQLTGSNKFNGGRIDGLGICRTTFTKLLTVISQMKIADRLQCAFGHGVKILTLPIVKQHAVDLRIV